MSDQNYKASIISLSIFAAAVLVTGCILSFIMPKYKYVNAYEKVAITDLSTQTTLTEYETVAESDENRIITLKTHESYKSLVTDMNTLCNTYPELLELTSAGSSERGRDMLMFKMGNGKKNALVIGAVHAREHITTKYLLRVAEDYCIAYRDSGSYAGYDLKKLFSEYTLYIMPCANPDGLEIMFFNEIYDSTVKVKKLTDYKANAKGVDINRNFPLAWNKIDNGVTAPNECYFKGYEPGDAKETQNLISLCDIMNFEFMLSFHVKGDCIFWADTESTENNASYKAFAKKISNACGFKLNTPSKEPSDYGGGFENWFRHTYQKPGLCIELVDNENIISPCDDSNYVNFKALVRYNSTSKAILSAMS
ncbi:MAG: M14 family zinc carboxypeptidase [Acutalibacteraceae bacterium]